MKNGFTIIELIVVIFIVGLLSTIIFLDYGKSGESYVLQRSASSLLQSLRTIEGMATNSQTFGTAYPSGGYGIALTKNIAGSANYTIFADTNNDHVHSGNEERVGELGKFESSINVSDFPGITDGNLTIIFQAPDPKVIFWGTSAEITEADVSIKLTNHKNNETKIIKINKAGLIYVE